MTSTALTTWRAIGLASEFQGFCRDLHDDVAKDILAAVVVATPHIRAVLAENLIIGRRLDKSSAHPAAISADFARLGRDLQAALIAGDSFAGTTRLSPCSAVCAERPWHG